MNQADDHFSPIAKEYARGRLGYPLELYRTLAAQCPARDLAWDCGCGSGQVASDLPDFFTQVIATDISEPLLALAPPDPRVVYRAAPAESSGLPAASVDLITVAQAVHWFDLDRFWREVLRVLKPGGRFFVEIGYDQKAAVEALFREAGAVDVSTQQDLSALDRVVSGKKRPLETAG